MLCDIVVVRSHSTWKHVDWSHGSKPVPNPDMLDSFIAENVLNIILEILG